VTHLLQNNQIVFNILNLSPYFYEAFCYYFQDLPGSLPFLLVNLLITHFISVFICRILCSWRQWVSQRR